MNICTSFEGTTTLTDQLRSIVRNCNKCNCKVEKF